MICSIYFDKKEYLYWGSRYSLCTTMIGDFCCANPTCAFEATDNDAGEYTISAGGHKNRILLLYIEGIPLNFSYK